MTPQGEQAITLSKSDNPKVRPGLKKKSPLGWCQQNLFSTPTDTILTLLIGYFCFSMISALFNWAVLDATWIGDTREACTSDGACWVFVKEKFLQFLVGFYPKAELWRVGTVGALGLGLSLPLLFPKVPQKKILVGLLFVVYPIFAWHLLLGGVIGLTEDLQE